MSYIEGDKYGIPYGTVVRVNSYTDGTTRIIIEDANGSVHDTDMGSLKYERLGKIHKGDSVVGPDFVFPVDPTEEVEEQQVKKPKKPKDNIEWADDTF